MSKVLAGIIHQCVKDAHETFEGIMNEVTDEVAHYKPQGRALPIGSSYVHVLVSEDILLNTWARKKKALIDSEWGEKLGISAPHPVMDENWEKNFAEWSKTVKIDLKKAKEYAQAVYAETDKFLESLSDKDLTKMKVDLTTWGLGEWPIMRFIIRILISHLDAVGGEMSAIKGLQGLKGYPF